MECNEVEELLSEYIEYELPEDVHQGVSRHLSKCLACQILKEQMEELTGSLPKLEEEVPFFLKNRLYYIPESETGNGNVIDIETGRYFLRWMAAVIATFLLFLNLFYFTNIYPPANRILRSVASELKALAVQTEAYYEKVKETGNTIIEKDQENNNDTSGT